ncbi:bleomycin hydrolase [Fopius arisanus]|uniref:Bleomycin hydrolase n=1 Tax=Fopius arisanus TaxID=64838 RepID=A0A0C9QQG8_9HYME|nr:PREDICTED: bleomycin hydrolase [Fopius arisanus]
METPGVLTAEVIDDFRKKFFNNQRNIQAQNSCVKNDPVEMCVSRQNLEKSNHVFQHKVAEVKPMTNQKNSGRCWLFAALNVIRIKFMKQYNLEEFEFSQAYLFFWDKIERSNFFLHNIIIIAKRGEKIEDRNASFLLYEPVPDGGQWDMLINLINRYGVVPKSSFPESWTSESSSRMNSLLNSKLREYARVLKQMVDRGSADEDLENKIREQMEVIFRIVGICLGVPQETITWEYYDKSKVYNCVGPITPLDFYKKYVKPYYNVDDKVCLVTDPRPSNEFGNLYQVELLGNMVGGRRTLYNNQPPEQLMSLVVDSIKSGEAVWFGSEVSKRFASKNGLQDLKAHDFNAVFGVDIQLGLSKADRLIYGESAMTHAMAFTAVSTGTDGKVKKLRVENSWGEERGDKGYQILTSDWFNEFVFEVVVDKKFVPDEVLDVFNREPKLLPAWDPMGCLARS